MSPRSQTPPGNAMSGRLPPLWSIDHANSTAPRPEPREQYVPRQDPGNEELAGRRHHKFLIPRRIARLCNCEGISSTPSSKSSMLSVTRCAKRSNSVSGRNRVRCGVAVAVAHPVALVVAQRIANVEMIFRPREGHVKQPPLLLDFLRAASWPCRRGCCRRPRGSRIPRPIPAPSPNGSC